MTEGESIITIDLAAQIPAERLDRALATGHPDISRERFKALIKAGSVRTLSGQSLLDPSHKVDTAMAVAVTLPPPAPLDTPAQDIALHIAFEDAHLIIVDKPAGLVVHPAAGNLDGTLVNALLHHCAGQLSGIGGVARPGIVHRIDKDTSGLLVVAKTDRAHEGLARQFADHSIHRRYLAIVNGIPIPAQGSIDARIGRSSSDRKKMAVVSANQGKHAITHYAVQERLKQAALVSCRLETGRTHQVRVHMAHIGHPLLGDPVYARRTGPNAELLKKLHFSRQALHAAELGFVHPVTAENIACSSPLPPDMQELFRNLRVDKEV